MQRAHRACGCVQIVYFLDQSDPRGLTVQAGLDAAGATMPCLGARGPGCAEAAPEEESLEKQLY